MSSPTPDAIRAAREAAGLTQTQAAELIYCARRGWQNWEIGARAMHPAFLSFFCEKPKKRLDRCTQRVYNAPMQSKKVAPAPRGIRGRRKK